MAKPCDPIKLLKQAAAYFGRQEDFIEAARSAFRETHAEIRPGPQSKVNGIQVFKEISQYHLIDSKEQITCIYTFDSKAPQRKVQVISIEGQGVRRNLETMVLARSYHADAT